MSIALRFDHLYIEAMWFAITLFCALCAAASDVFAKRTRTTDDPYVVAAARFAYSLPFLWLMIPFIELPGIQEGFWPTMGYLIPLEITAGVLYVMAIRLSPLSLTLPHLAFTPVLVVLTGMIILQEVLSPFAVVGIFVVTLGAYLLHFGQGKGWFAPFRALVTEPGSRLMLIVAAIYAVTSAGGKKAILLSSPTFFVVLYFTLVTIPMLALLPMIAKGRWRDILRPDGDLVLAGLFQALMVVAHCIAMTMIEASIMITVKRTSLLFGVLFGWLFFAERQAAQRFVAAALMVAGIALILLL